ncbi:hypothetical protein WMF26_29510 [Sorangium sp. So ce185]|uniref:hypothetical protein n=1 Tax=Sorangium sp. So ce185 TaxID=3133287 RepID=UPI003F61D271
MPERPAYAYTLPTSAQADQETREAAARRLVEERHAGQRYGQHPYCVHLAQVRAVLAAFGHGGALGVAAWLHDALQEGFEQALAGLGTRGCGRGCGRRSATDLAFRQEY